MSALPQGDYVYEDLSSDFVETQDFLEDLEASGVTGYLSFEGDSGRGFALVEDGHPRTIKLFEGGAERVLEGREGVEELFRTGSYTVDVVDCDDSGREIVTIKVQNEEFKSGIDTGEIDLQNFLATNITDQDNDCHLLMVDGDTTGIATFVDGLPVQAKFSTPDEILVGAEALDRILDYLGENAVTLDVYKLTEREVEEEVGDKEEVIGEHVEDELEDLSETFEDKADDLLDEMGMDFMGDDGGSDDDGAAATAGVDDAVGAAGGGGDDLGGDGGGAAEPAGGADDEEVDDLLDDMGVGDEDEATADDGAEPGAGAAGGDDLGLGDEAGSEAGGSDDLDVADDLGVDDGDDEDDSVDELLDDMGIESDE